MGLVPYNFDSEYSSRGKLQSSIFSHRKNCATIPLFCMIPTIFQIVNNPNEILFCFSFKNLCKKNVSVREFCFYSAI